MAEAIFNEIALRDGTLHRFQVSSAGTKDWDVGSRPDYRTEQVLHENNFPLNPNKKARQITESDINNADFLIVMSQRVASELGDRENINLLMDFVEGSHGMDVPDPYPTNTFPQAFEMIHRGIQAFYDHLKANVLVK